MAYTSIVLIVDDEQDMQELLETALSPFNYDLHIASDGLQALELAAEILPDVILLDVILPGMNGLEVCRHMRANPTLADVPILILTALNDHTARLLALQAGADDCINKPLDLNELQARVQTITRLNRYRRLMAERARFEWVVDNAADGFLMIDEHDHIHYLNQKARLLLHLPIDAVDAVDAVGALAATPPHTPPPTFLALAQQHYNCEPRQAWTIWPPRLPHLATGDGATPDPQTPPTLQRYLVRPETRSAASLWLQVDPVYLPAAGTTEQLIRLHDVTHQMAQQRHVWTFHALISHKLNTSLTSIIGGLSLLSQEAELLDPAIPPTELPQAIQEIREVTDMALKGAYRLQNQISHIQRYLTTSDIAHPGEECPVAELALLVAQIQADLGLQRLTMRGADELPAGSLVLSYEGMDLVLRQVLDNACKFHPTNTPTIDLTFSHCRPDEICIEVADNGASLSPEQLLLVWQPYYQGERTFTGEIPGMGLGLAIVARLLWSVGGRATIRNRRPPPGVVVDMIVPMAAQE